MAHHKDLLKNWHCHYSNHNRHSFVKRVLHVLHDKFLFLFFHWCDITVCVLSVLNCMECWYLICVEFLCALPVTSYIFDERNIILKVKVIFVILFNIRL
jgi:hypothetical protein